MKTHNVIYFMTYFCRPSLTAVPGVSGAAPGFQSWLSTYRRYGAIRTSSFLYPSKKAPICSNLMGRSVGG